MPDLRRCPRVQCRTPLEVHTNGVVKCPSCDWAGDLFESAPDTVERQSQAYPEAAAEPDRWEKRVKLLEARQQLAREVLDGKRDDLLVATTRLEDYRNLCERLMSGDSGVLDEAIDHAAQALEEMGS